MQFARNPMVFVFLNVQEALREIASSPIGFGNRSFENLIGISTSLLKYIRPKTAAIMRPAAPADSFFNVSCVDSSSCASGKVVTAVHSVGSERV